MRAYFDKDAAPLSTPRARAILPFLIFRYFDKDMQDFHVFWWYYYIIMIFVFRARDMMSARFFIYFLFTPRCCRRRRHLRAACARALCAALLWERILSGRRYISLCRRYGEAREEAAREREPPFICAFCFLIWYYAFLLIYSAAAAAAAAFYITPCHIFAMLLIESAAALPRRFAFSFSHIYFSPLRYKILWWRAFIFHMRALFRETRPPLYYFSSSFLLFLFFIIFAAPPYTVIFHADDIIIAFTRYYDGAYGAPRKI